MKRAGIVLFLLLTLSPTLCARVGVDSLRAQLRPLRGEDRLPVLADLVRGLRDTPGSQCSLYAVEGISLSQGCHNYRREAEIHRDYAYNLYNRSRYNEAILEAQTALQLSEKNSYPDVEASAHNTLGLVYRFMGDLDVALDHFQKADDLWGEKGDVAQRVTALGNIGTIQAMRGNYEEGLASFTQILRLQQSTGKYWQVANTYNNIGIIYEKMGQIDDALKYYQQAYAAIDPAREKRLAVMVLNNLANIYNKKQEYAKALETHERNLALLEHLDDPQSLSTTYSNIGVVYDSMRNYAKAVEYKLRSVQIKERIDDKSGLAHSLMSLAATYSFMGRNYDAVPLLDRAIDIARERDERFLLIQLHEQMADIQEQLGNYKEAYFHYKEYATLSDSVFSEESSRSVAEIQAKYDTEKKQREIDQLRRDSRHQNTVRALLILVILTLAVLSLMLWNRNNTRRKANIQLSDQKEFIELQKNELQDALKELQNSYEELRAAQQEIIALEQKNSALAMAVTANHEINQPLMVISGNIDLLEMATGDPTKRELYIQRIRTAITGIQNILRKMHSLREVQFQKYSDATSMLNIDEEEDLGDEPKA